MPGPCRGRQSVQCSSRQLIDLEASKLAQRAAHFSAGGGPGQARPGGAAEVAALMSVAVGCRAREAGVSLIGRVKAIDQAPDAIDTERDAGAGAGQSLAQLREQLQQVASEAERLVPNLCFHLQPSQATQARALESDLAAQRAAVMGVDQQVTVGLLSPARVEQTPALEAEKKTAVVAKNFKRAGVISQQLKVAPQHHSPGHSRRRTCRRRAARRAPDKKRWP